MDEVKVIRNRQGVDSVKTCENALFEMDIEQFLDALPEKPIFDLVVTSPPYNIGKEYEKKTSIEEYEEWQERIIQKLYVRLKDSGSICWQVGNYVENNELLPLDYIFAPIFRKIGMHLRNRIIWHFGHGLHTKKRFSGRYEIILWYTKSDEYTFNLDSVRIPSKYPGKRHSKGPNKGELSGNPLGKNPEDVWEVPPDDVWEVPNVKSNHVEKTQHPCQFPVGLIERLVLSLTNEGALIFDPFAGSGSAGVAAIIHGRHFWGCEYVNNYVEIANKRLQQSIDGTIKYRPYNKPIYDCTKSRLSDEPEEWKNSKQGGAINDDTNL